jgi:hypothetical protein
MAPDLMTLTLQIIFIEVCKEQRQDWHNGIQRASEYVRSNFASWRVLKGRCKRLGLAGILLRFDGAAKGAKKRTLPAVRRSSKYEIVNALRFFRVLVHETLMAVHPVMAQALLRLMEFARLCKSPTGPSG